MAGRVWSLLAVVALVVGLSGGPAEASRRIALLIGNLKYGPDVGPLKNPHNDIRVVGDALRGAGFSVLEPVRDAGRAQILRAVRDFAEN
jgi:uncharacterized caspase-like protein